MKRLGFGLMRLPLLDPEDYGSVDYELTNKMVDYYLDKGFNYFDTAYTYHQGKSEVAVGEALSLRHKRESFFLTDKMPTFLVKSSDDYQRFFEEQLKRCKVEYFNCYLLHTLGEKNYANTLKYGGFKYMKKLKAEGRAEHIGFSYHDKAELLDKILTEHPEMEYVQLQINYVDWDDESIESRKCYEVAQKHNKPVIVMEPVKGGSLASVPAEAEKLFKDYDKDASVASWAMRFAGSLDHVFMVLSGMSTLEQLEDNAKSMGDFKPLNFEERKIIEKAVEIITANADIPCTACQYCVADCPANIPIPKYFSLYNNQKQFGLVPAHTNYYINLIQNFGKASACIECGQCERNCPQHIKITEKLKEVSQVFDRR